jgi:hypothetical protein
MRAAFETIRFAAVAILAACAVALPATLVAQSPDPFVGTWKMDPGKSTYKPAPGSKSSTLVIEAAGKGMKVSVDAVTATGPLKWGYTAMPDGKDVPVTGNPNAETASMTLPSSHERVVVFKRGGKPALTSKAVVAKDGKVMTITQEGTDAKGQAVHNVLHYVKQ